MTERQLKAVALYNAELMSEEEEIKTYWVHVRNKL